AEDREQGGQPPGPGGGRQGSAGQTGHPGGDLLERTQAQPGQQRRDHAQGRPQQMAQQRQPDEGQRQGAQQDGGQVGQGRVGGDLPEKAAHGGQGAQLGRQGDRQGASH